MRRDSLAFVISAAFAGLIITWILLSQRPAGPRSRDAADMEDRGPTVEQTPAPPPLDEGRAADLRAVADQDPRNVTARIELGKLYFDAERFDEAITWYERALALDPGDVNVSTDLGLSYFYTNQPDRALAQFERSLAVDPTHTKTMLNVGIVRAYAKQDLDGAEAAWERVIEMAPDSPEARVAQEALDRIRAAHPDRGGVPPSSPRGGG